jgi:hypothetical protein
MSKTGDCEEFQYIIDCSFFKYKRKLLIKTEVQREPEYNKVKKLNDYQKWNRTLNCVN